MEKNEKTAGQKARERFFDIKKRKKCSPELLERFKKKDRVDESSRKIARSHLPENEA